MGGDEADLIRCKKSVGSIFRYDDSMAHRTFGAAVALAAILAAVGIAQTHQGHEESIRTLIKIFADARNSHDGQTIAGLYSVDGEWISSTGGSVRGRPVLAKLWGSLTGHVQRTIESIDFAGNNIAVVRVVTQYWEPIGRHHETFVFVKAGATWEIRVHQSVE